MDAKSITHSLGGRWWRGGYGVAPCPICQIEQRRGQRALTLRDGPEGKLYLRCKKSNCSFIDLLSAIGFRAGDYAPPSPHEVAARQREEKRELQRKLTSCAKIWAQGQPIAGTLGESYLHRRGLSGPFSALRFVPELLHTSSKKLPAILAKVEPTGGLSRVFLMPDGGRDKMMLGPCKGGAVRVIEGTAALLVGEGIESTLSAWQLLDRPDVSAWAALSTSGMRGLVLPEKPGELIIAVDGDAPGRAAGADLADRAAKLGWQVSLADPGDGLDWNDKLCEGRAAA